MAWNCIVYVLEDEIIRYLILLTRQDFALKLCLEDERPEIHHIIWSTDILEQILFYMISPNLAKYLVQTSFLKLFEILEHMKTLKYSLFYDKIALLEIGRFRRNAALSLV